MDEKNNRWCRDLTAYWFAAIDDSSDCPVVPIMVKRGDDYVEEKFQDFTLYCCYFSS